MSECSASPTGAQDLVLNPTTKPTLTGETPSRRRLVNRYAFSASSASSDSAVDSSSEASASDASAAGSSSDWVSSEGSSSWSETSASLSVVEASDA